MNKLRQLLRGFAWWILASVHPLQDETDAALIKAFGQAGINPDHYTDDYDLLHSGKMHEILVHASRNLGNPLVTVADIKALLR